MGTLREWMVEPATVAQGFGGAYPEPFDLELRFTEFHRATEGVPPAEREAAALGLLLPAMFQPIAGGDRFAGRIKYPLAGFSPEPMGLGWFCCAREIREAARALCLHPARQSRVGAMLDYWAGRTTQEKVRAACPPDAAALLPSDAWTQDSGIAFPLYRIAGSSLDFEKLLRLGLDGLLAEVREKLEPRDPSLSRGMAAALDTVRRVLRAYASQAAGLAREAAGPEDARAASRMAASLAWAASGAAPRTLHEALQLAWVYALASGTWGYGRMDIWAGPFLDADLKAGRTIEAEALDDLCSLWRLMKAYENHYNNRVFIGGLGRPDEPAADRFALLAIEATRRTRLNQPQLSMRFHRGQNPALMARALDAIGEGCTFPMLYNDDVNVPAVARAFNLPESEAVHYLPFGCGEYAFDHRGIGSPNAVINLLKALEITLHGGRDPETGAAIPIQIPPAAGLRTFEDLWNAYASVIEAHAAASAKFQRAEYGVMAAEAPLLLFSALHDDCLDRGQALLAGGVRWLGATLETYGNINTADSLAAIKRFVFEEKRWTLPEVVAALDANFEGHDAMREALRAAPKYGNDDETADAMAVRVHDQVCRAARDAAAPAGLHSHLVVIINNWANTVLGKRTGASADGRGAGEPMANANNPAPGADRHGATAFLNSLVKPDPGLHAGAVQNMKFSRGLFTRDRRKLEQLLQVYWTCGGTQAMITVVSREDLEAAMREPEKWGHLMVRVGGFSIRFVDLPAEAQREVLRRTLHE